MIRSKRANMGATISFSAADRLLLAVLDAIDPDPELEGTIERMSAMTSSVSAAQTE